jgi:hypothetical protein
MFFHKNFRYHKYFDDFNFIKSVGGKIILCKNGITSTFIVDYPFFVFFARFNLFRRLLRLNRINIRELPNDDILVIYNFKLYLIQDYIVRKKITFNFTRYVHDETISIENNKIVIGEYGNSNGKYAVGVYISNDFGVSWIKRDLHSPGVVKNILSVKFDTFSQKYWVFFGESKEQSRIETYDLDWSLNEIIGFGDILYRAISSFFTSNTVFWFMNNPGGDSFLIKYDRFSGKITKGYKFPGPIWYSTFNNGQFFLSTASEESTSNKIYVLVSNNCEDWEIIKAYEKDLFNKKYFLYGMVSFPIQHNTINKLLIYCEALKNNDNKMDFINF